MSLWTPCSSFSRNSRKCGSIFLSRIVVRRNTQRVALRSGGILTCTGLSVTYPGLAVVAHTFPSSVGGLDEDPPAAGLDAAPAWGGTARPSAVVTPLTIHYRARSRAGEIKKIIRIKIKYPDLRAMTGLTLLYVVGFELFFSLLTALWHIRTS